MHLLNNFFRIKDKLGFRILMILNIILSSLYSALAVLRHNHFQSGAFDLGLFDQAVWQYSRFQFPFNTIKERFILGDHLTLTLPLLSPLYYFWNDVRSLLIFQAVFITFSSIGIYKLAIHRKLSPFNALIISIIYSLFYGIQTAVSFDFHPIVIAVGILVWVAYFFETKNWKLFYPTLVLLLLTQENTGIALAGLGFVYLFHRKYRKTAIAFIVGGIGVSLIETKIVGLLSPIGYQYTPHFPNSPLGFITGYFDASEKIDNWKFSLIPLDFLPLASPGAMLAVLLDLAQYYIAGFPRMWTPYQHHRAILAPFFILGLIEILVLLKNRKVNISYILILVLLSTLTSQYAFHFPLDKLSKKSYWQNESWMADDNKLLTAIPPDASVAAAQNIVPHISHRNHIYLVWPRQSSENICGQKLCWWLDFDKNAKYLFVDLHPGQWITQLLESNKNFSSAVSNMEKENKIKLIRQIGNARLYKVVN